MADGVGLALVRYVRQAIGGVKRARAPHVAFGEQETGQQGSLIAPFRPQISPFVMIRRVAAQTWHGVELR